MAHTLRGPLCLPVRKQVPQVPKLPAQPPLSGTRDVFLAELQGLECVVVAT